jgi:hypothetical protein
MKYSKVLSYVSLGAGLAVAFFIFEVVIGRIGFSLLNFTTFLISAAIGTILGALYYQLIGYKFPKFKFLLSAIISVFVTLIITKLGINKSLAIHDVTILISCLLVILSSFESKKSI